MTEGIFGITRIVIDKPDEKIQNLAHLINKELLSECHMEIDGDKAFGIDGMTKDEYSKDWDANITRLLDRMKKGAYNPLPIKRVYIPKGEPGKMRPLGISVYEDKLVQNAIAKILNEIYEPIFLNCSYGFRKGLNCHKAIAQLENIINKGGIQYVVEADIRGFFDNVNHEDLITMLNIRIADKRFTDIIVKLLKVGVMEQAKLILEESEMGTPQGSGCSPILANVYLHYLLDNWFEKVVKKYSKGKAYLIRYADDFVCCFQRKDDAEQFFRELPIRLGKGHLEVAEEKTKLLEFGSKAENNRKARNEGKPETFDFLGFTVYCSHSANGNYRTKVKTNRKRLAKKVKKMAEFLKENRHLKWDDLIKKVNARLVGHYNYYGVTDNIRDIALYQDIVKKMLFKNLNKRSQRKSYTWDGYNEILKLVPLSEPKICVNLFSMMNAF